ncbi:MAG TPA: beta-galactosidase trimerization domain-containing protein [Opitutaceae bacterium]
MQDLSRRNFIKASAAAGAVVTLGRIPLASAAAVQGPASAPWADKPMRWAQLTLVENDPGRFDEEFWLDYFRRTKSDAVCLSAGGCVAYYPTRVPFHHRSAWLGDRDVFGSLVEGCRKMGMVVIGRTDPHATYDDVRAAHPDWLAASADGSPRRHWSSPEMWVTCALGPYNFEFMTDVKREIMSRYRVDGIFINRWDGSGLCHCVHCRKNFRDATGLELPISEDPDLPSHHQYLLWRQARLFELWRKWDGAVREINPDSCVIPNTGGGATSALDMKRIGELAPTLMADRQSRRGLMAPWANGKNAKEYRAAMGPKPVVGIFAIGLDEVYRWKDSVQHPAEVRLWAADGIANGMRPWFTKFGGMVEDRRWLKPVEEIYNWCAAAEPYLRNERPLARVALVYSQQTGWFHRPQAPNGVEDAALGWYQALVEARIPFEMVHDRLLDEDRLAPFRTLILPNIASLSDAQCAQLRRFVQRGGGIVATSETSLEDEWGARRADFGLADLFGARWAGGFEGPMKNAYLRLGHDETPGSPLLRGLEDTPRIIHGVWRVDAAAVRPGPSPLTLIPSYPDLPMEKVYPRQPRTHIPQVFLQEGAGGRVVYFPWDIDRTYWDVLAVDHGVLMRNAVSWATNEEAPLKVEGPGVLDVTFWKQKNSFTVHLVNLTNPMMLKGPVREVMPVGSQALRVRLPWNRQPRAARLLVAGVGVPFETRGGWTELTVPSVAVHEVVAFDV